jgi:putative pyruvate formate lyase activating enzyme
MKLQEVLDAIIPILDSGIEAVGFVSPSHFIPHVRVIVEALHQCGYRPFFVYNTNAYDKEESLRELEGLIDIYLPDFKYLDPVLAKDFSDAGNYPEIAVRAIKEMYRQKGSTLIVNDRGQAESGLVIRHLVLPGCADESISILRYIAEEISTSVHISLMSQYYPTSQVANHYLLNNKLSIAEYEKVTTEMEALGFKNGWIQEMDSAETYRPDFDFSHPFENGILP